MLTPSYPVSLHPSDTQHGAGATLHKLGWKGGAECVWAEANAGGNLVSDSAQGWRPQTAPVNDAVGALSRMEVTPSVEYRFLLDGVTWVRSAPP